MVLAGLSGRIAAVLDGGPTGVGLESTIIGLGGDFWMQLRKFARETMIGEGVISAEDIAFIHPTESVAEAMSYLPPPADLSAFVRE